MWSSTTSIDAHQSITVLLGLECHDQCKQSEEASEGLDVCINTKYDGKCRNMGEQCDVEIMTV